MNIRLSVDRVLAERGLVIAAAALPAGEVAAIVRRELEQPSPRPIKRGPLKCR